MLKKSITYTDFTGDTVTEDYYFHLSKADLVEMEVSQKGGMAAFLEKIAKSEDGKAIITEFKNLILTSYGQRSEDGRRFIKNAQLREEFLSSEAYSALFFELCTNADAAAAFVNGIVPPNLEQELARVQAAEGHPSDTAATMAPMHNESMAVRPPATELGPQGEREAARNVFENGRVGTDDDPVVVQGPRVLTHAEALEMDSDELRSGLATGRYTLR